ncbi:MAG TPA: hypothetical protein VHV30_04420 [Polyangiaceae bacterium]|nr:hypothetical protein [Polyangiaceae bacterium]
MPSRRWPSALPHALTLALLVAPAEVHAADRAPFKVLLRVDSPESRGLLTRLRGHLVDTTVDVLEDAEPLERDLDAQLQAARTLGRGRDVQAVVWCERARGDAEGELVVAVLVPSDGRVLLRWLPQGNGSAAVEMAAIVVRSLLEGLASGGSLGVTTPASGSVATTPGGDLGEPDKGNEPTPPTPDRDRSVPLSGPPKPPPPETATVLPPKEGQVLAIPEASDRAARASEPDRAAWALSLGWQASWDGTMAAGQEGLAAEIARRWAWGFVGVAVDLSVGGTIEDAYAQTRVTRHSATFDAGLRAVTTRGSAPLSLWALVHTGVGGYERTTDSTVAGAQATSPRWTLGWVVGPDVRVEQSLGGATSVALTGGVDVWTDAPSFGNDIHGVFVASHDPWFVQPRVALELTLENH